MGVVPLPASQDRGAGAARVEKPVNPVPHKKLAALGVLLAGRLRATLADLTAPVPELLHSRPHPQRHNGRHSTSRPRPRAMTIRWTSEVPSPISSTLASR